MSWPDFEEQLQNNSAMMTANRITARAPFQPVQIDSLFVFTLFGCLIISFVPKKEKRGLTTYPEGFMSTVVSYLNTHNIVLSLV